MTEKELEELEIYLEDEYNNDIYNELLHTDYKGLFEPLEFFRLFYSQVDFVEKNKNQPLFVIKTLNELKLSDKQKIVFFDYLDCYIHDDNDRYLKICHRQIQKLIDDLKGKNEKAEILKQDAEFEELLNHLETLPNNREKISYLKQAKNKYEKTKTSWENFSGVTFDKKCQRELEKLEELRRIEIANYAKQLKEDSPVDKQKDKDLTLDRAVLIFSYLFDYAKVDARNTDKAEFISFLTGFSKNTVVQKLSKLHEKAD